MKYYTKWENVTSILGCIKDQNPFQVSFPKNWIVDFSEHISLDKSSDLYKMRYNFTYIIR